LPEVRDRIRQKIYSQKLKQRYEEYVQELRSKAVVDVRL
jgi:peptidyl-prolyl cis-trans isomerase SurA